MKIDLKAMMTYWPLIGLLIGFTTWAVSESWSWQTEQDDALAAQRILNKEQMIFLQQQQQINKLLISNQRPIYTPLNTPTSSSPENLEGR